MRILSGLSGAAGFVLLGLCTAFVHAQPASPGSAGVKIEPPVITGIAVQSAGTLTATAGDDQVHADTQGHGVSQSLHLITPEIDIALEEFVDIEGTAFRVHGSNHFFRLIEENLHLRIGEVVLVKGHDGVLCCNYNFVRQKIVQLRNVQKFSHGETHFFCIYCDSS